jgi:hypothetical protein
MDFLSNGDILARTAERIFRRKEKANPIVALRES